MRLMLGTVVMAGSMSLAIAAGDPALSAAPGVAEMLQRRQESQLREQLAKEGRWEELKRVEEEQLRRQQVQKKQTLTRLNAELAREGTVEAAANGDGVFSVFAAR